MNTKWLIAGVAAVKSLTRAGSEGFWIIFDVFWPSWSMFVVCGWGAIL